MIPPPPKRPQENNIDSWLMTYADMITLILCFFIIFVATSKTNDKEFSLIADGIAKKFGLVDLGSPFIGIMHSLQNVVQTHDVLKDVGVEKTETSVNMELSADMFFKTNSADLEKDKLDMLKDTAVVIRNITAIDYRVSIEAYTNDIMSSSVLYPTNWELTSSRSAKLVRLFIDEGVPADRLRAIGYGSTHPEVSNFDERGQPIPENRSRNNRIVIKIERVL